LLPPPVTRNHTYRGQCAATEIHANINGIQDDKKLTKCQASTGTYNPTICKKASKENVSPALSSILTSATSTGASSDNRSLYVEISESDRFKVPDWFQNPPDTIYYDGEFCRSNAVARQFDYYSETFSKSPPIKLVISASHIGNFKIYNFQNQKLVADIDNLVHDFGIITDLAYVGRGTFLVASDSGCVFVFNIVTKSILSKYQVHDKRIVQINYNPKYAILVTASLDQKIKIVQVLFGAHDRSVILEVVISHSLNNEPSSIQLVEYGDHLNLYVSEQYSTILRLFEIPKAPIRDVNAGVCMGLNELQSIELYKQTGLSTFTPTHMAFAPDGSNRLAVMSTVNPQVRLTIIKQRSTYGSELDVLHDHLIPLFDNCGPSTPKIRWSFKGKGIWATGDDEIVRGIEVASGKVVHELQLRSTDPHYKVNDIDLFNVADEDVVISATQSGYSHVWGRPYELYPTVEEGNNAVYLSPELSLDDQTPELAELRLPRQRKRQFFSSDDDEEKEQEW
jgi:WD40 repeat protein